MRALQRYQRVLQQRNSLLRRLQERRGRPEELEFWDEELSQTGAVLHVERARALMGDDFWPYGLEPNRKTLETFLRHHHSQGLSSRPVTPDELFHPSTHETFKI